MTDASPSMPRKAAAPFGAFERALAWRYLRARRKDGGASLISAITFFGISIAVAALIVVMSVMGAAQTILVTSLLSAYGHVTVDVSDVSQDEAFALVERIETLEGIDAVMPVVEGIASLKTPFKQVPVTVRGIRPQDLSAYPRILTGSNTSMFGQPDQIESSVLVGFRIANIAGAYPGMTVSMQGVSNSISLERRTTGNQDYFLMADQFVSGSVELDQQYVLVPLSDAQPFLNKEDQIDTLDVRLIDYFATEPSMAAIRSVVGEDLLVTDWKSNNQGYLSALRTEKELLRLTLVILIIITSLNIISGTIMLVKNKARDVAILRTMGVPRASVMRVFVLIGSYLGVAGTLFGLGLGILIIVNFPAIDNFIFSVSGSRIIQIGYFGLDELPAELSVGEIVFSAGWAIFLSIFATLSPAARAAGTDPIETLRSE